MTNIFDQMTARSAAEQELDDSKTQTPVVDSMRTAQRLREALQALLSDGLLEQAHKPNMIRTFQTNLNSSFSRSASMISCWRNRNRVALLALSVASTSSPS